MTATTLFTFLHSAFEGFDCIWKYLLFNGRYYDRVPFFYGIFRQQQLKIMVGKSPHIALAFIDSLPAVYDNSTCCKSPFAVNYNIS